MNKVEFLTKVNTKINKLKLKGKKNSPEIFLILGISGLVTGTILACVGTTKLQEINEKKEDDLEDMHNRLDDVDQEGAVEAENRQAIKKETTAIYLRTGIRYARVYAPAVVVSSASLACIVYSNVILRKRLIGVSAAYATVASSFKEYRGRVAERYGDDAEKEIRYNIKTQEIQTKTIDAKGKEKVKKEKIKIMDPNGYSDYARVWETGNPGWTKDPQTNLQFLKCQQVAATERLKRQGYLFLNDVYEMLGFPKIKEGQVAGWIYNEDNPIGDNLVDFGMYDVTKARAHDFINGYERSIVLDFNIDGNILEFI